MRNPVVVMVVMLVGVVALSAYVTQQGPSPNDRVYGYLTEVTASVEVADSAFDVTVAGVSSQQLEDVELWQPAVAAVVVTVTPTTEATQPRIQIDVERATVTGTDDLTVEPATVEGGDRLDAGVPTVITLPFAEPVEVMEGSFSFASATPTTPVDVTFPILAGDEVIATVTASVTPHPVSGDDLGIAGTADIPDERLPKPEVGEAIPIQLDDGRPVWVVGLDDNVAVVDARSTHRYSGLVGWCGSMPGFIDSIGASRFTATGEYRFGPAPHGLLTYEVEVADDHVLITHRLAPQPRPQPSAGVDYFPQIEGSPVEQGRYCDIDGDLAQHAYEEGYFLEDYRDDPTWTQHDLADWPALEEASGDGWFRTDEHHLADGGPHLVGDLLVHRERGVIIDAASPPGTARTLHASGPAEPTTVTGRYAQATRADDGTRAIAIQPVMWVTETGVFPADSPPRHPDAHLVPTSPTSAYQLAGGVTVAAQAGDVVTLTIVDQVVTEITPVT